MTAVLSNITRPAGTVTIDTFDQLDGRLLEQAWELYQERFDELNSRAVQLHLMHRADFNDVMTDPRWTKYVAVDDRGDLHGLATFTNDLDAVTLISTAYFETTMPEHYKNRRIWYIGFMAIAPAGQAQHTFTRFGKAMYDAATANNGVIAMDFCRYNLDELRLAKIIEMVLWRIAREDGRTATAEELDTQAYYLFEFPDAT